MTAPASNPAQVPRTLRRLALRFARTPLHPQFFSFRAKHAFVRQLIGQASGLLLDIGSAEGILRGKLPAGCTHVELDHPGVGQTLYRSSPHVFADAQALPFIPERFDQVALLDVLEHLREPRACLREIHRVLKPGGTLHLNVPYLYPLHDEPHDFQRPTRYGLEHWLRHAGFEDVCVRPSGTPAQTCALLVNIATARWVLRAVKRFPPLALLGWLVAFSSALVNVLGWVLGHFDRGDACMPFAYAVTARRHPPARGP